MPICVNCKTMLPPEAFKHGVDGDPRCIFCVRGNNIVYVGKFQTEKYTKGQAEQDYKEVLTDLANKPNIKNIVEMGKKKDEEAGIIDI